MALVKIDITTLDFYLDSNDTVPEPMPSGEKQEGKTWQWSPNVGPIDPVTGLHKGGYVLRFPKQMFGPGDLSAVGYVNVTTDWTDLAGPIPTTAPFERAGGQYPGGRGRMGMDGHIALASDHDLVSVFLRVVQGTTEDDPIHQPNILNGNRVVVGEGCGTIWKADYAQQISFQAIDIQSINPVPKTPEILIQARHNTPGAIVTALPNSGFTTNASRYKIWRWDGDYGET
jgi:hypothetical protein